MTVPVNQRPTCPRQPLALLRVLALGLAVLAVVLPSVFGGAAYVWCEGMRRAMVRPCCPESHHERSRASLDQPCCEDRHVAGMPTTDLPQGPGFVPPPVTLALAMCLWLLALRRWPPRLPTPRGAPRTRAGPAPPLYRLHCALLR